MRTEGGASIAKKLYVGTDLDVDGTAELDNITIGGSQGSDGQVLTSTGSGVAWENAGGGAIGSVANGSNNRVATFSSSDALNGESGLTFDGSILNVSTTATQAFKLTSTNSNSDVLQIIAFGNGGTGTNNGVADNNDTFSLLVKGISDAGNEQNFGWISLRINEANDTSMKTDWFFGMMDDSSDINVYAKCTYAGVWTDASDAALKTYEGTAHELYGGTEGRVITDKLKDLEVGRYHRKGLAAEKIARAEKHISPTAQDFYHAFGTGTEASGLGKEFTQRLASLTNVCGYFVLASVHNIHTAFSGVTPATPAALPLGTLKNTE